MQSASNSGQGEHGKLSELACSQGLAVLVLAKEKGDFYVHFCGLYRSRFNELHCHIVGAALRKYVLGNKFQRTDCTATRTRPCNELFHH